MRQLRITKSITVRDSRSIDKYLQEISKIDLITGEEEVNLARQIKKGDKSAVERLINANLRFVVSVAKQYQYNGMSLQDMISEGNVGLIKAVHRFDETKCFKFISYAVWWIRQSIVQAIGERGRIVRIPANQIGLGNRIQKVFTELEQEHERSPTAEELGAFMNISVNDVHQTLQLAQRHISLDAPLGEEGSDTLLDTLKSTYAYQPNRNADYTQSLALEIKRSLKALTSLQNDVVRSFYGLGIEAVSLADLGRKHGLTTERIRQIKATAICKLKISRHSNHLKSFL